MALRLETRHTKAAQRIADGTWHMERIATEAGVSRKRLYEWLAEPEFLALIEQQRAILHAGIVKRGIADKQTRLDGIVERHQRLAQVIEYRAVRYTEEIDADTGLTPGGLAEGAGAIPEKPRRRVPAEAVTGMVLHQTKFSPSGTPIDEWAVDTGTSAEMRNLEKQMAQELGEWTEKTEHSGDMLVRTYTGIAVEDV